MKPKAIIKDLSLRALYGHKGSEETYVSWLRSRGMRIG